MQISSVVDFSSATLQLFLHFSFGLWELVLILMQLCMCTFVLISYAALLLCSDFLYNFFLHFSFDFEVLTWFFMRFCSFVLISTAILQLFSSFLFWLWGIFLISHATLQLCGDLFCNSATFFFISLLTLRLFLVFSCNFAALEWFLQLFSSFLV